MIAVEVRPGQVWRMEYQIRGQRRRDFEVLSVAEECVKVRLLETGDWLDLRPEEFSQCELIGKRG